MALGAELEAMSYTATARELGGVVQVAFGQVILPSPRGSLHQKQSVLLGFDPEVVSEAIPKCLQTRPSSSIEQVSIESEYTYTCYCLVSHSSWRLRGALVIASHIYSDS